MTTRKKDPSEKAFLERLGKRVETLILRDQGYPSLDAFSLEHHDLIKKATLYQLCAGQRDLKLLTLRRLARALEVSSEDLVKNL